MNNIPLYLYSTSYLFIHQLTDIWIFYFWAIMNYAAVQDILGTYVFICLGFYQGELLGHMVNPYLMF